LGAVGGSVVVCRNCGDTGHWTLKCPKRGAAPSGSSFDSSSSSSSSNKSTTAAAPGQPGKYVPVHQREGPKRAGVTMVSLFLLRSCASPLSACVHTVT
jgi:hypothetical protein